MLKFIKLFGMRRSNLKFPSFVTFPENCRNDQEREMENRLHGRREWYRVREKHLGDEIYRHRLASARYINNDIGVFTSTRSEACTREVTLAWRRAAVYNSPRRESCTLNRVTGIDTYWPVRRYSSRDRNFSAPSNFNPRRATDIHQTRPARGNRSRYGHSFPCLKW